MGDLNELSNPIKEVAYKGNSTTYNKFNKFININNLIDISHLGILSQGMIKEKQLMLLLLD